MVLDHVGSFAAVVQIGVMDPGIADHMLSHVIDTHIHQLAGVQGAPAFFRGCARMGGNAGEVKADLIVGYHAGPHGNVLVCRMPGEHHVHSVEAAGLGHKALSEALLLCGTAEKYQSAGFSALLQIRLCGHGGSHGSGSQGAVAAAVSGGMPLVRLRRGNAGLLAQARKGIVFAQDADHGRTASPDGFKRRRDPGQLLSYCKAVVLQGFYDGRRAFGLLVAQFGIFPYGPVEPGDDLCLFTDGITDDLCIIHKNNLQFL